MERHFTATTFIIDDNKVLLVYHRKLQKWLPPGGHLDPNETPPEAARREVLEETGLEISFIMQENLWFENWNAKSFERPFMCSLENIPAHGDQPEHQHIDLIYVARPIGGKLCRNETESRDIRWFTLDEVEELKSDAEIFQETKQAIQKLLQPDPCHV